MERRWSHRQEFESEVMLSYKGVGLLRGQTKNISYTGAFVETGMVSVPANSYLDLVFTQNTAERSETVRISAYVVHSSGAGVGVLFNEYDDGARRFLENIMLS